MKFSKICFSVVLFFFLVIQLSANSEPVSYLINDCYFDFITQPEGLASTYFNNKVYLFRRTYTSGRWSWDHGGYINCRRFDIASNGQLKNYTSQLRDVLNPNVKEDGDCPGTNICTCVYNGKIYVFYDYITKEDWSQRYIYYKTSPDPENQGWAPAGGEKIKVGSQDISLNVKFGWQTLLLTATVLDSKLYLFVAKYRESRLSLLVFDGQKWTDGPSFDCGGSILAISAQSVIDGKDVSKIAIAVKSQVAGENKIHVLTYTREEESSPYKKSIYYFSCCYPVPSRYSSERRTIQYDFSDIQAIFGSSKQAKNTLWIFTDGKIFLYDISAEKNLSEGADVLVNMNHDRATTAVASYVVDSDKNLQMYITFVEAKQITQGGDSEAWFQTHKSDYFKFVAQKQIDTSDKYEHTSDGKVKKDAAELERECKTWTLVGVVEGTSPFSLNGNPISELTQFFPSSTVTLIKNDSSVSSVTSTYGQTTSFGVHLIHPACGAGVSSTFTNALATAYRSDKSVFTEAQLTFSNSMGNLGKIGWLIFEKPSFTASRYMRYASDKKTELGNVIYIFADGINLDWEEYSLNNNPDPTGEKKTPTPAGMVEVSNSDNIEWWETSDPHPDSVNLFPTQMNLISVGKGASTISTKSLQESSSIVTSTEQQFQLDLNAIFATSSLNFSVSQQSEHSFSFGKTFSVSGFLLPPPDKKQNYITKLTIQPLLKKPKEGLTEKPSWVPTQYASSRPWLLTWNVKECRRRDDPSPVQQQHVGVDSEADQSSPEKGEEELPPIITTGGIE